MTNQIPNQTKLTLALGQDVTMVSGCYHRKGKVIRITPEGIDVQINNAEILQFDANGRGLDGRWPWENGTFECGPWIIQA